MKIIKKIYNAYSAIIVTSLGTSAFFFTILIMLFCCTQIWNADYKIQINSLKQEKLVETQKEKIDYLNTQIQHIEFELQSEKEKDRNAVMIILGFAICIPLFAALFILASILLDATIKIFTLLFDLLLK